MSGKRQTSRYKQKICTVCVIYSKNRNIKPLNIVILVKKQIVRYVFKLSHIFLLHNSALFDLK